jgi:aminoglycoside phosphotransferase (APT) family kinase protein
MPVAEVDIDVDVVAALIENQRPDLSSLTLTHLAHGWDNVSYKLGDDRVVRLPRRDVAVPLISHEAEWLPVLSPGLPLEVPVPEFVGRPGEGYPWPWLIVPFLQGTPAASVDDVDLVQCARQMADFLVALHRPAPEGFPPNPYRGTPLRVRAAAVTERLGLLDTGTRKHVAALWDESLDAPPHNGHPLWIHGDLHPLNVLIEDRVVSGVIDFGDITAGDPATDLAIVWSLFATAQDEFWDVYGGDDALRLRARGWAIALGLAYLANSADNPTMDSIGRQTIEAVTVRG